MPTFTFSDHDIGNGSIVADQEGSLSYMIHTTRNFADQPKQTTLTSTTTENKVDGAIDWKKKSITIGGLTKSLTDVKHKTGGILSQTREWQWSTKKYVISFQQGSWTAKHREKPIAIYAPLKPHPFKKDELATFNFLLDISHDEMILLMFALLFSDLQLPPRERKSFKGAAGEAAGTVAVGVASNAVSASLSCCSIQ